MKCKVCGAGLRRYKYYDTLKYSHPLTKCLWSEAGLTKPQWEVCFSVKKEIMESVLEEAKTKLELDVVLKECETLTKELSLMEHKVLTCGVAATNKAAEKKGSAYLTDWNSPQAERVRKLREEKESLELENTRLKQKMLKWVEKAQEYYLPDVFREMKKEALK